jgi:hypothetical protein
MANNALGHLWQAFSVNMLCLEAGNLHRLTANPRTANFLAVCRSELLLAVLARLHWDPAGFALGQRALVPFKRHAALAALRSLPWR